MWAETLERRLVEHLLILRMRHRYDEFGAFLKRAAVKVHCTVFGYKPMDVVARGDSARAQIQRRHDFVDALPRGRRHCYDGLAALGTRRAVDIVYLTTHARVNLVAKRVGAHLSRQVNLDCRVD